MQDTFLHKYKQLFWDVDIHQLDKKRHANFIITRILEMGNFRVIRQLLQIYPKEQVLEVVRIGVNLKPATISLWQAVLA